MSHQPPKMMNIESPWILNPGRVRFVQPPAELSEEEIYERLSRDELAQPYIIETMSHRYLHFTHQAVQSTMRLKEPDALISPYTRKMMAFLLFNPAPRNIVMIGLGGGSLPKFCYRHFPAAQITVIEIDAAVIALRDEFYIPKDNERFRVVHDDGARYIARLDAKVDAILVDAFDSGGIAPGLADLGFYAAAAAMLTRDGVLVMNLSGEQARFAAHLKHIRAAFGKHTSLVPVMEGDNLVLFAYKRKMSSTITDQLENRAQQLQDHLGLDFPRYLRRICQGQWSV